MQSSVTHIPTNDADFNSSSATKIPVLKPYLTPYFSSKLKQIASQIRSNAQKRFKLKHQDGQSRFVIWSQFKQISDSSKDKDILGMLDDVTGDQLDSLMRKEWAKLSQMESSNLEKRKQVEAVIQNLTLKVSQRKNRQRELSRLRANNKQMSLLLSYWKELSLRKATTQELCMSTQSKICALQDQLFTVKNYVHQIPKLERLISQKQSQLQALSKELVGWQYEAERLMKLQVPHQQEMIHCMFLIGILTEQIHILVLQKKQKANQRQNCEKVVSRSFKIHQKLARREILIQCNNKETIPLKVIIAIYMHCKSLTINNIANIMNTLSFFSEEFKEIYHYRLFHEHSSFLLERLKLHSIKEIEGKKEWGEGQMLKRKLCIIVQPQYLSLLKWILQKYEAGDDSYMLCLGPFLMTIDLVPAPNGEEVDEKQEVTLGQYNELKIRFVDNPQHGRIK